MRLLVVGATGLLGSEVCRQAMAGGADVRALVRSVSARSAELRATGCALAIGDMKDPASLAFACRGADVVVTTANSMLSRRAGDSLEAVDWDGSLALIRAAVAAGVGRFIYTSVLPSIPANNRFVQYKREVEHAVRTSGMTWTVLQPTAFMEVHTGAPAGWDFVRARARIAGTGKVPMGFISIEDVAAFAVASLRHAAATNHDLALAGPEPLTALEAVHIAERVTGRRFSVQRAPLPVLNAIRAIAGRFNPHLDSLIGMMVGQETSAVTLPEPLYGTFGVTPTSFEDYVRREIARTTDAAAQKAAAG